MVLNIRRSEDDWASSLNRKGDLGELAQSRCPRDDLAHLIRPDLVAAELEKFTSDALNFHYAKTETHEPGADGILSIKA
jgi:hypothetical protein